MLVRTDQVAAIAQSRGERDTSVTSSRRVPTVPSGRGRTVA